MKHEVISGRVVGPLVEWAAPFGLAAGSLLADSAVTAWRGTSVRQRLLALLRGHGWPAVARGLFGATVLGAIVFGVVALAGVWLNPSIVQDEVIRLSAAQFLWRILLKNLALVALPEELAFRVFLWNAVDATQSRWRLYWPLVITSFAFGAWHIVDGLPHGAGGTVGSVFSTTLAGFAIGALFLHTGSLPVAVVAHWFADDAIDLARYSLAHVTAHSI